MERWNMWLDDHKVSDGVKETIFREYGYLMYMAGLFITYEKKVIFWSILQTTTYITVNLIFSTLVVITGFKLPSLTSFSQYMNYFSLGVIEMGIYLGALTERKAVTRLLEIMTFDFYDYGETFHNPLQETWKKELKRFKIIVLICIPVYLAIVALSVVGREWINMMLGYDPVEVDYVGEIYQRTPIPMWLPIPVTNFFIWFYDCYNTLAKWPTGFAVLNGSVMIAMSILAGFSSQVDVPSTYIINGLLLVAEVLSMWLLCETGQRVSEWSEILYNAMYEFSWIDLATSNKRMILIMKEKIKKPLVMMAGGLTPINRDTFGTIINTAYSYVNLLRASEQKTEERL